MTAYTESHLIEQYVKYLKTRTFLTETVHKASAPPGATLDGILKHLRGQKGDIHLFPVMTRGMANVPAHCSRL